MIALLLTVDYPPNKGGVSRYYEGLVEVSDSRIGVAGIDLGSKPPIGNSLYIRIQQIFWARKIISQTPRNLSILSGQPHLGIGAILARRKFGIFVHGGEWGNYPLGTLLVKVILYRANLIIANSKATAETYIPKKLNKKYIILRPGLANFFVHQFNGKDSKSLMKEKDFIEIISVSRLSPRKGLDKLIRAVELLIKEGWDVKLNIIGNGIQYEELSRNIGFPDAIKIIRDAPDGKLMEFYENANLFILLPRQIKGGEAWEGFGIALLEAGAVGLPIITTNSGGIAEATNSSGTIYLNEKCSVDEIYNTVITLVQDKGNMNQMGKSNRQWALKQTWSSRLDVINQILKILR